MSVIKVRCTDQVLSYENTPVIASGGLDENFVAFAFCSQWDGYEKTAVFWRSEDEAYHCLLDESDTCPLPPEVTMEDGIIWLGAFGVDVTGRQRTSEVLSYRIVKGAITEGTKPSDPTPDIYTQILAELATIRELAEETKAAEEEFEQFITQQQSDFETAAGAAQAQHIRDVAAAQAQHVKDVQDQMAQHVKDVDDRLAEFGTGMLLDGSVTTPKLAFRAVTTEKLALGAVEAPHIVSGAVTADKLGGDVYEMFKDVVNLHVWELTSDEGIYYVSSYFRDAYTEGEGTDTEKILYFSELLTDRKAVSKIGDNLIVLTCHYDDLQVATDGTVTMKNYIKRSVTVSELQAVADNSMYIMIEPAGGYEESQYTDLEPNTIYWLAPDCIVSPNGEGSMVYISGYQEITGGVPGLTNATIKYIGQLGRRTATISAGEYVGTGSAQTLTFDFEPKYLVVTGTPEGSNLDHVRASWVRGVSYGALANIDTNGNAVIVPFGVTANGDTLTISTDGPTRSGETFHYVAIG